MASRLGCGRRLLTARSRFPPILLLAVMAGTPYLACAGHLPLVDDGVPIDILWFRIARQSSDPENALGYVNYGRFVILINRNDYFQVGYLIAKGSFPALQQRGLPAFRESLERIVPFLAGRTGEIDAGRR